MTSHYHYKACGLDYVYLADGFRLRDTDYGRTVAIKDAERLHAAIGRVVVGSPRHLRGQELRFLRARLDLSQAALARVLGTTRAAVARWEGKPDKALPGAADRALRLFYALKAESGETARHVVDLLGEIDDRARRRAVFRETRSGWQAKAA